MMIVKFSKTVRGGYEMPSVRVFELIAGEVLCASPSASNQSFENDAVEFIW